jgi:hypothetical protein
MAGSQSTKTRPATRRQCPRSLQPRPGSLEARICRPAGGEQEEAEGGRRGRPVSDGSDGSGPPLSPISSSRARDSLEPLKTNQGYRRKRKITAITANTYSADRSSYCRSDSGGLQTRSVSSRVISAAYAQPWLLTAKHIAALIMAAKIRPCLEGGWRRGKAWL